MRFGKGSKHTDEAKAKVSKSLIGNSRRWKGTEASHAAIHMWVKKHWGKPDHCDYCHGGTASRYEWANLSGHYFRNRIDWLQLCPPCHRRMHAKPRCPQGHFYTADNTILNVRGHRECKQCRLIRRGRV